MVIRPNALTTCECPWRRRGTTRSVVGEPTICRLARVMKEKGRAFGPGFSNTGVEMFRKILDRGEAGDNVGLLLRGVDKKKSREEWFLQNLVQ